MKAVSLVSWGVLVLLAGLAVAAVLRVGPLGLVILGLMTLFVCSQFSLDEGAPTSGVAAFRARMTQERSAEARAAAAAEREGAMSPLRFYRWCGAVLTVAGAAAFLWQRMG